MFLVHYARYLDFPGSYNSLGGGGTPNGEGRGGRRAGDGEGRGGELGMRRGGKGAEDGEES